MSAELPPLILELRARAGQLHAELAKVRDDVEKTDKDTESSSSKSSTALSGMAAVGKAALFGIGGAALAGGLAALKLGTSFQESTTQLVTGAGESEDKLSMVRNGILSMAGSVGQMPIALSQGMFLIESAGYHGAQGLNVLRAAAEGAKIGGADMQTVADGLTTALTDYHLPASQAARVTSELVATVASGKTTMGDLSGALAHVLPFTSSLGVSMSQTLGAMASMTSQGIDAATSATYLKSAVMILGNESTKGAAALAQVGLSAAQVHSDLATKGLTGTLDEITAAVGKRFPAGSAAYTAAMSNISGGMRGMAAVLALTGTHAKQFAQNVRTVGSATTEAGGHVKGWSDTSKDLATQIDMAKATVVALGTRIGMALIPRVESAIRVVSNIVTWFGKHTTAAKILGGVIGGALVLAIGAYIAVTTQAAVQSTANFVKMLFGSEEFFAAQKEGFATSLAGMIRWVASAVAASATYIATQVANGAAAAAAFVAENAATLGIVAGIGLLIAGAVLLATHWHQVWGAIKSVALSAWNDVIRPVFNLIKDVAILPLRLEMKALQVVWSDVWDGIKTVISGAWNDVIAPVFSFIGEHWGLLFAVVTGGLSLLIQHWRDVWNGVRDVYNDVIKPVFGWIKTVGIDPLVSAVHAFQSAWGAVWGAVGSVVQDAWNVIKPIIDAIKDAVSGVLSAIGSVAHIAGAIGGGIGKLGSMIGLDTGGFVPGAIGAPMPAIVHGGEFMLSHDMLSGRSPIPAGVLSSVLGSVTSGVSTPSSMLSGGMTGGPSGGLSAGALPSTSSASDGGGGHVVEVRMPVYLDSQIVYEGVERVALQKGSRRGQTYPGYRR